MPSLYANRNLGPDSKPPGVPGRAFCSWLRAGASPCASSPPQELTPGRWTSVSCVVGFEVQPAEPPGPLLSSQIFHIRWQQFNEEQIIHSQHSARIDCLHHRDIYFTFTGGPLARTSHILKCLSHPEVNTVTISTPLKLLPISWQMLLFYHIYFRF